MLRLVTSLCLTLPLVACMTETDQKIWAEFKNEVKSDDTSAATAPEAQAESEALVTPAAEDEKPAAAKTNTEAPAVQDSANE